MMEAEKKDLRSFLAVSLLSKMHERQLKISYCILLNAEKRCFVDKKCKKGLTNHHKLYTISNSE